MGSEFLVTQGDSIGFVTKDDQKWAVNIELVAAPFLLPNLSRTCHQKERDAKDEREKHLPRNSLSGFPVFNLLEIK